MQKIFVIESSIWRQMKENYQIYLPYQFHWRAHSVGGYPQLPRKKMKTLFLSNMSKNRRLTSTFFPIMKPDGRNACTSSDFADSSDRLIINNHHLCSTGCFN